MSHQVLVIDESNDITPQIEPPLRMLSCHVKRARDARVGLAEAASTPYDLIILDLAPGTTDGLEVCRRLRAGEHYIPIILLSQGSGELDCVLGLEIGADHYLARPFSPHELVARIRAMLRLVERLKSPPANDSQTICRRNLHINLERHEVTVAGRPVELTATEFQLLLHLARHPGRVYTRAQLLDQVWGYHHSGYEHTVNSHINRLRSKIEATPDDPEYIQTVRGAGYKFRAPAQDWDSASSRAA